MEYEQNIEQLLDNIKKRNGKPANSKVIAATIESYGLRDIDIKNDYSFTSIIEISEYLFNRINNTENSQLKNANQLKAEAKEYKRIHLSSYIGGRSKLFVRDYSTGLFHLFPILIQIITIIIFGFSLWTYTGFNNLQSTAIVFGVIIGLVSTGGFVQIIGKEVSFYWYNKDFQTARSIIKKVIILGIKSMIVLFALIITINFFIPLYPLLFIGIVFVYAFLIGILILTVAPLYTIKKRFIISIAISIGTLLSLWLHLNTKIPTYFAHWIGILTSLSIPMLYLQYFFKKEIKLNIGIPQTIPKITYTIYKNMNHFFYGVLVYAFIFMDRIIAWSSHSGRDFPYIIYYEKDYEIGMDLAILVFFFLSGVLEYSIASFTRYVDYFQHTKKYNEINKFNEKMTRLYNNNIKLFVVSSLIIFLLLYLVITQPWGYQSSFNETLSSISLSVCLIGSLGYLFLTFGMLNVLYLFTLNKHEKPLRSITVACIINLITGVFASRIISYEYASIGMLIGAFIFAVLTTRTTRKFFKNIDYYYYAAY